MIKKLIDQKGLNYAQRTLMPNIHTYMGVAITGRIKKLNFIIVCENDNDVEFIWQRIMGEEYKKHYFIDKGGIKGVILARPEDLANG